MVRIPFGGIGRDPMIDQHADPLPLLAEIAACAYKGIAMRPALASWYYSAWRKGRVVVTGADGSPPRETVDRQVDAVIRVRQLVEEDRGPKRGKTARAIAVVCKEMNLQVKTPNAVYGWLREIRKIEDANRDEMIADYEALAMARFRELLREGRTGESAVRTVYDELEVPFTGWLDDLRKLQAQIAGDADVSADK